MKTYLITYTADKEHYDIAVVRATTYTKALLEFTLAYPNCEYTALIEVMGNESAYA
jgi:hypothetical protein